jgi:hypothetical protein
MPFLPLGKRSGTCSFANQQTDGIHDWCRLFPVIVEPLLSFGRLDRGAATSDAITALEEAGKGLLYQSETEAPFSTFK